MDTRSKHLDQKWHLFCSTLTLSVLIVNAIGILQLVDKNGLLASVQICAYHRRFSTPIRVVQVPGK